MTGKTVRTVILILAVLVAAYGCSRYAAEAPAPQPVPQPEPSTRPPVPTKGTGLKERAPVLVATGDRLGWVDNAVRTYPSDQFLTGLGIGPDRKTAHHRSLNELEKPFIQAINGRFNMQTKGMGMTAEQLNQAFGPTLDRQRERTLAIVHSNARVAEIFLEKNPALTYYALAVLDRRACSGQLASMVHQLDRKLDEMVARLQKKDALATPREKRAMAKIFFHREALDAAISVIMPQAQSRQSAIQATTIGRLMKK